MSTNDNELQEGKLYKFVNGELVELQIDPNDLPRIKITEPAYQALNDWQHVLRKSFHGIKPDKILIASSSILFAHQQENFEEELKQFISQTYQL